MRNSTVKNWSVRNRHLLPPQMALILKIGENVHFFKSQQKFFHRVDVKLFKYVEIFSDKIFNAIENDLFRKLHFRTIEIRYIFENFVILLQVKY